MRGPGSDKPTSIKDHSLITGRKEATYIKQVGGDASQLYPVKNGGGVGKCWAMLKWRTQSFEAVLMQDAEV